MEFLKNHIEALIFCASKPLKIDDIKNCLNEMFDAEISEDDIIASIEKITEQYLDDQYSFQVFHIGGGYQFLTKPSYQASISILLKQQSHKRLSTAALETLSIIAYKQPVTKAHVEQIRGVGCDYAIQKLLEKSLIEIKGKDDTIGKPLLYGTTEFFMQYFGINRISDLPTPKDFDKKENEIGIQDYEDEDIDRDEQASGTDTDI
ncbi:SMC-Scp complex subunit ScpB [Catalinimonas niigatensis]|uniref:SMC-Scp complex subunit ScpB n=1 Tax=Catalinimonas niigatensis TaxID=1397264 RepID=UPI002665C1B5|nr:SMC-Scp complex subunit ScpB [Catalinimonas niigatensis]WPP52035.1 SMC-Scp complex subunit ScpB [Catalinimonas niigatensis]